MQQETQVRALWDYPAVGPNELPFKRGDIITLIAKSNQDWWEGALGDRQGFFPANRVLELGTPVFKAFTAVPSPPASVNVNDTPSLINDTKDSVSHIKKESSNSNGSSEIVEKELSLPPRKTSMQAWALDSNGVEVKRNGAESISVPDISQSKDTSEPLKVDIKAQLESLALSAPLPPPLTVRTQSNASRLNQSDRNSPPLQLPPLPPTSSAPLHIPGPPEDVVDIVTPPRSVAASPPVIAIRKEGPLNYRNRSGGQKHLVRNWTGYWAELTDSAELRLFKDAKNMGRSPRDKPAFSLDLNRCQLDSTGNLEKKRATFALLNTDNNEVFLLQAQSDMDMHAWAGTLISVCPNMKHEPFYADSIAASSGSGSGILKRLKNHMANLSSGSLSTSLTFATPSQSSNKDVTSSSLDVETKEWIKAKLFGFFKNRPTLDALQQKGIIPKDLVFGGSLESQIPKDCVLLVPPVILKCIKRIEMHMETEGLYRLSGNSSSIQKLRIQVNSSTDLSQVDFNADEWNDVNVITGLLKLYLRELKDPLLTYDKYWDFIEIGRLPDIDERLPRLQQILFQLPDVNYQTLKYLINHLNSVCMQKDVNKMNSSNLATVFGPTLLRPAVESMDTVMNIAFQNTVIDTMITYSNLFIK